jgi:hypothetical protein
MKAQARPGAGAEEIRASNECGVPDFENQYGLETRGNSIAAKLPAGSFLGLSLVSSNAMGIDGPGVRS